MMKAFTRRAAIGVLGAGVAGLSAGHGARAQAPVVVRFSHVVPADTPKGRGAERFKALAEQYGEGRIRVEVHPNGQLFGDADELDALRRGEVEMLAPPLAKFGPAGLRAFEVFDLPYIFRDHDALRRVTRGPAGAALLGLLAPMGIAGLAFWDNGFKIMSANTPLLMPADFAGLRMRIQPSRVLEAQMVALGAVPQVMAFAEVADALRTGAVDGTENPPSNMLAQRINAVQRHATVSNHGYLGYAVIADKVFWDGLADGVRDALGRALAEATEFTNAVARGENETALAAMRAAGTTEFHEMTEEERRAWLGALLPVHARMAERIGADVIAQVKAAAGG
jgi:C4-dicarboxylate-binding protein DctP